MITESSRGFIEMKVHEMEVQCCMCRHVIGMMAYTNML